MLTQGELLKKFTKVIHQFCTTHVDHRALHEMVNTLQEYNNEWGDITAKLGMKAMDNPDEIGAAAVDYLMYSGYVTLAYFWASMAAKAHEKIDAGSDDPFYNAKIQTAKFYFAKLLPRARAHAQRMEADLSVLMELEPNHFWI